jgi:hypothetical protein
MIAALRASDEAVFEWIGDEDQKNGPVVMKSRAGLTFLNKLL